MTEREILIIALVILAALSIAAIVVSIIAIGKYRGLYRRYDMFMRGKDAESLEEFILRQHEDIEELKEAKLADRESMRVMNRNIRASLQKFGIVHYDAFEGMGGKMSVMGVNIENTARHPSTIGVAVNVGCWSHRRGHIIFDKNLNYEITTHSGVTL